MFTNPGEIRPIPSYTADMVSREQRGQARLTMVVVGVVGLALVASGAYMANMLNAGYDASNYQVVHKPIPGWEKLPQSFQMEYGYRHKSGIEMRASSSQVVDDVSLQKGQTAKDLAAHYIAVTKQNMPGWYAKPMGTMVSADGETLHLIDRGTSARRVITAFMVKGNSTFMFALVSPKASLADVEGVLPAYRRFLEQVSLAPKVYER